MARRIWIDRIVERPRTFNKQENPDGTITLIPAPGQIIQEGTPVNATNLNGLEEDLESHKADYEQHANSYVEHGEIASFSRSEIDSNGVFTIIEWQRPSGSRFKMSILSGGTSPKYTTRTVTYYDSDGTTIIATNVYELTYINDDIISEVLQ